MNASKWDCWWFPLNGIERTSPRLLDPPWPEADRSSWTEQLMNNLATHLLFHSWDFLNKRVCFAQPRLIRLFLSGQHTPNENKMALKTKTQETCIWDCKSFKFPKNSDEMCSSTYTAVPSPSITLKPKATSMLPSALGWSVVISASVWSAAKRKLLGFTQSEHQSSGSVPFLEPPT